jgi:CDP-diglyceride synthetase
LVVDRIKNAVKGALGGALFGVFFAAVASLFHGGPELIAGINETWWWFAGLGAFAGLFAPPSVANKR